MWERVCQGDRAAFEGFYSEQAGRLRNFLRHYLGDAQAADDIAQEAFMQLWRHPNGFNPARGNLKAYLFGIARKKGADWWRQRKPGPGEPEEECSGAARECSTLIADALARLEPEKRSLLWLREAEGYSYAELAEVLDIPVGTVKSRLSVAREELRRLWRNRPQGR